MSAVCVRGTGAVTPAGVGVEALARALADPGWTRVDELERPGGPPLPVLACRDFVARDYLPPLVAIPLHGVIQLVSNGSRVVVQRRHARFDWIAWYTLPLIPAGLVGLQIARQLPETLVEGAIGAVVLRSARRPSPATTTAPWRSAPVPAASWKHWTSGRRLQQRATAIREIQVRKLNRPGLVILDPGELGLDSFGHVVEARSFGAAMTAALPALRNLHSLCPAEVTSIHADADRAAVQYTGEAGPATLEAALLVGADGANSFVREALGIADERYDYGQTAVICNVTPEHAHQGRAFECFTPTGPFAVMPHVEGRCGLIWCVATEDAPRLLDLPEPEFLAAASRRFGNHLGAFLKAGRRSSHPLRLVRAREDVRPRVVLLGNAAHAIHPSGAQGFNLGLRDAAVLAEVLADTLAQAPGALEGAIDLGGMGLLRPYSDWRAPDQEGTVAWSRRVRRRLLHRS